MTRLIAYALVLMLASWGFVRLIAAVEAGERARQEENGRRLLAR